MSFCFPAGQYINKHILLITSGTYPASHGSFLSFFNNGIKKIIISSQYPEKMYWIVANKCNLDNIIVLYKYNL